MSQEATTQAKFIHFYESTKWRLISYVLWIGLTLALLMVLMAGGAENLSTFMQPRALQSFFQTWLITAMMVPPMILVVASGGIDLSVGAVAGFVATSVAVTLSETDLGGWAGLFIALRTGILIGLVHGLLIGLTKVHSAVITLGMATLLRGLSLNIYESQSIGRVENAEFFSSLTIPIIILMILFVLAIVAAAEFTPFGRKQYSDQDNEAWLPRLIRITIPYLFSSIAASFAGLMLLARLQTASPNMGIGLEVEVLLAVFMAGIPMGGGLVNAFGAMLASLVIGLQKNLTLLSGESFTAISIYQGLGLLIFGSLSKVYFWAADQIYQRQNKAKPQ